MELQSSDPQKLSAIDRNGCWFGSDGGPRRSTPWTKKRGLLRKIDSPGLAQLLGSFQSIPTPFHLNTLLLASSRNIFSEISSHTSTLYRFAKSPSGRRSMANAVIHYLNQLNWSDRGFEDVSYLCFGLNCRTSGSTTSAWGGKEEVCCISEI